MKDLLVWLSGARKDLLALAPGDRPKYVGIGSAILLTGSIAGIAMAFALDSAVKVATPLAVLFGLAWMAGIILLDRWLVASIQRGSLWQNVFTAVPRLALAVLFGVVISTPLVLRIFEPEIAAEIVRIHQADADRFQQEQKTGGVGREVASLTAQRDALQKTIGTGGDAPTNPETDPTIIGLRSQLAAAQKTSDAAYDKLQCQLYGPCKPTGPGPLAQAAQRAYDTAQSQVNKINGQIETRKQRLGANDAQSRQRRVADAERALPGVQSRLDAQLKRQKVLQDSFDSRQRNSDGLLIRIEALDQLSATDSSMRTAHRLLIGVFTVIEILPVLVKLMMLAAPRNTYEKIVERQEREELARADIAIRFAGAGGQETTSVDDEIRALWGMPQSSEPDPPPAKGTAPLPPKGDSGAEWQAPPEEPASPYRWDAEQLQNMPDTHVYGSDEGDPDFDAPPPPPGPGPGPWANGSAGTTRHDGPPPPAADDDDTDRLLEFDDD
ncbi:DUF4407 domain-containing protein [Thermomonospora umbrina]|uniref:Uncharacterized protein DUF4407 n=1 Tax=Thermomonospora umbrina TaxID=111806 RepID=A0A3D9SWD8_9ACTN|nr:DUF4407 domain-containing protein [Thermomonospora umbrina]REE96884.1 uncharacterized protein DUF4407 [Thermomonospora umbrina]